MEDFRTVSIKVTVKVNKSQIFLQGSLVMWNRKIVYSFHTIFQRGNACGANAVAEEIESGDTKLTLVRIDDQPILRETCGESAGAGHALQVCCWLPGYHPCKERQRRAPGRPDP